MTRTVGVHQDAVEEEFDLDPEVEVEVAAPRWFSMARYYSAQRSSGLFDEMGAAWCSKKPIPVRSLDDNKYILEFKAEEVYKFIIKGSLWRYKGDTLIVVPSFYSAIRGDN